MTHFDDLLTQIMHTLGIPRASEESEENWKARIVFSAVGCMALASLWDQEDDGTDVSIVHFRRIVESGFTAWTEIFPELKDLYPSPQDLSKKVYVLFRRTGCLYHRQNRICPPAPVRGVKGDLHLFRGAPVSAHLKVSGMGFYAAAGENLYPDFRTVSAEEMFQLPASLAGLWSGLVRRASWQTSVPDRLEFLNHHAGTENGFQKVWETRPQRDVPVTLARTEESPGQRYYLWQADGPRVSAVPDWVVQDPLHPMAWATLANACQAWYGQLPVFRVERAGACVWLQVPFLLAPPVLSWLHLYSWPDSFTAPYGGRRRLFTGEVFPAVQAVLEGLGYTILEHKEER